MNADGSGVTRLTTSPGIDATPDWSPDGTRIVFASTRDGNSEIYVMNADGSGQTRITVNSAFDGLPSWK
jgi:TolB protein